MARSHQQRRTNMPKVACTITADFDATDPTAEDATVDISSIVIAALSTRFYRMEFAERAPNHFIINMDVDIDQSEIAALRITP